MSKFLLPQIFQNHMMLQREKPIRIQGISAEAMNLRVVLDTFSQTFSIPQGSFQIALPPQSAGRGKTLAFYCDGSITPELLLEDISIGDLWLAAGQSNMEYFMRYDAHWQETRQLPVNPDIHMYNCPQIAYEGQNRNLPYSGYWFQQGDAAWDEFSAPGYYFARYIQPDLDVPVGIIGCNWGGTPACAWISESYLQSEPLTVFQQEYEQEMQNYDADTLRDMSVKGWAFEDSYRHQLEWRAMMYGLTEAEQNLWQQEHADDPFIPMGPYHHYRPAGLYHTMLESIASLSLKGVLWYQGESDSNHADIYDQTLTAMIQCFRDTFQEEKLPFLLVQLAPFGKWLDCTNDGYALVRQQQDTVTRNVENVYLTSIMDLGMWEDIHPKEKREVGRRLALLAKGNVYGFPILCNSPELSHVARNGNVISLYFKYVGEKFHGVGDLSENFDVSINGCPCNITTVTLEGHILHLHLAGEDTCTDAASHCANSSANDNSNENTAGHYTISYANRDYCVGNIWNDANLPLKPFVYKG